MPTITCPCNQLSQVSIWQVGNRFPGTLHHQTQHYPTALQDSDYQAVHQALNSERTPGVLWLGEFLSRLPDSSGEKSCGETW